MLCSGRDRDGRRLQYGQPRDGLTCPKCADTKACKVRGDCVGDVCSAAKKCITPSCSDGIISGTKTDVDCGGPDCPRCAAGEMCKIAGDCTSGVCTDIGAALRCQPPSCTDGILNGDETDVDCGGSCAVTPAGQCATAKSCKLSTDCKSLGCDYNNKCAAGRSCTTHYGGDTCGAGGPGGLPGLPASWESCCTTIPVTTASGGTVYMDKYPTTSGRMRVFLESVGYDVRTAVQGLRAAGQIPVIPINASNVIDGVHPVLDPSWDPFLPTSFAGNGAGEISDCSQSGTCALVNGECPSSVTCTSDAVRQPGIYSAVRNHLGGNIFKSNAQTATGCYVGGPGTHSFRFPDGMQDGALAEQPVEVYDTKTLNCVDNLMAQAFCVWDGGRLETYQEWQAASGFPARPWAPGDTRAPVTVGSGSYFGCRFPCATDADQSQCGLPHWAGYGGVANDNRTNQLADYQYSYEYPKLAATQQDYIVFLTPPGRTAGRGPLGHSDLLGAGFEQTSNVTWSAYVDPGAGLAPGNTGPFAARHRWSANGSWEVHAYGQQVTSSLLSKYGKLGLRCVKFAPN